jgi:hypothetical protein
LSNEPVIAAKPVAETLASSGYSTQLTSMPSAARKIDARSEASTVAQKQPSERFGIERAMAPSKFGQTSGPLMQEQLSVDCDWLHICWLSEADIVVLAQKVPPSDLTDGVENGSHHWTESGH